MSFLSIAFLTALPLSAAPIILHLFDRRRSVVIEWGAMQFLLAAATRKTRVRRLRHWLLLLLRVAAVAALVLALARPMLPGHWLDGQNRRETILVFDTSLSTQRDMGGRTAFDRLVDRADAILDELRSDDRLRILASSPYPTWVTPASVRIDTASRAELHQRLRDLRATDAAGDVRAALLKAVRAEIADEAVVERRVVLLTDGQRANWNTSDALGWTRFREALANAPLPTGVEIVEAAGESKQPGNLTVNRLRVRRELIGVHQSLEIRAELQNYSAAASPPSEVVWSIDGQTLEKGQAPSLAAGQTHDLAWTHTFDKEGVFAISCRLPGDDLLPGDNAGTIVVEVVERLPVLLVETVGELAELQQSTFLVRAALGRSEENQHDGYRAVFEPLSVPPDRLETIALDEFRAVVIPNFTALSGKAVDRLTEFVSKGGGLWLALGPRTQVREFNKLLFNDGDGLSPVAIEEAVDEPQSEGRRTTINPFQKAHPATAELADSERLDTGDVRVLRRFRFRKAAGAGDAVVLLDLTNGDPLAVERRVASGRVIVQAVPLAMSWSDLAVSQAFVVMIHDWLAYLAEPAATRHNLLPGEELSIVVPRAEQPDATLATPAGDFALTSESAAGGRSFRTSRTLLPGHYSLEIGLSGDAIPFHVARDPIESDMTSLTAADWAFLALTAGLGQDGVPLAASATMRQQPIWPALLVGLIALIAAELLLSGAIARQRFGSAPIAETTERAVTTTASAGLAPVEATTDRLESLQRVRTSPLRPATAAAACGGGRGAERGQGNGIERPF